MARRNRHRARQSYSGGATYSPPRVYAPAPRWEPPTRSYRHPLRTRALALGPPVFAQSTVRPPLMRTVFTDTTSRWSPPSRRRSPDLPNRALARMQSWTTHPNPVLVEDVQAPRHRALVCARRSIRREVLLALRQGNGAGSRNKPKDKIKCAR